ncbi:hypothetical protein EVAR_2272_1 [Eumeta japonica]|uniref:Mariner Mos1 transposase n=1 Tax=Eumeta variegata TaxID=151549 RepID=A0A4C1SG35_EUMVA|nr:hypothetical protein EVAR_2272_1 [Eumeta japonica]
MKNLNSRWIPHNLTKVRKTYRVTRCNAMLTSFKEGESNMVWYIVTGDEIWIYCYDPKKKQQLTVWVYRDEPKSTIMARERSSYMRMIASSFDKTGHVGPVALRNCRAVNRD